MKYLYFLGFLMLVGAGCTDLQVEISKPPEIKTAPVAKFFETEFLARRSLKVGERAYVSYEARASKVQFTLVRPSALDERILLSVPGTYTSPRGAPEGFIVQDGRIVQNRERQGWNGIAVFKNGQVQILESKRGTMLTPDYMQKLAQSGASMIQGHLLVVQGAADNFKPQAPYQRRALAVFADGRVTVMETEDLIDLQTFADDLEQLGVQAALNLDMGSYGEGWYRNPEQESIEKIGYLASETDKQSNWIVFSK